MLDDLLRLARRLIESLLGTLARLGILVRFNLRFPVLDVTPTRGPSGTLVTIRLSGALPSDPVTLLIQRGSQGFVADANGQVRTQQRIFDEPGAVVAIEALVGPTGSGPGRARAQFTVTNG